MALAKSCTEIRTELGVWTIHFFSAVKHLRLSLDVITLSQKKKKRKRLQIMS